MVEQPPKTIAELKTWIAKEKDNTWSMLRQLSSADPALLRAFGYGGLTQAEAVKACFDRRYKDIEKRILDWERDNPRDNPAPQGSPDAWR
jgi:hypothetical protein